MNFPPDIAGNSNESFRESGSSCPRCHHRLKFAELNNDVLLRCPKCGDIPMSEILERE